MRNRQHTKNNITRRSSEERMLIHKHTLHAFSAWGLHNTSNIKSLTTDTVNQVHISLSLAISTESDTAVSARWLIRFATASITIVSVAKMVCSTRWILLNIQGRRVPILRSVLRGKLVRIRLQATLGHYDTESELNNFIMKKLALLKLLVTTSSGGRLSRIHEQKPTTNSHKHIHIECEH